ncbi:MAG TPA: hypothetical protein VFA44_13435 [Gaiellaceae bacterium]|nr:hypothetical protein [Gaiellaceae bacterium]
MLASAAIPPSEHVHWWFATGFLILALCLLARAVVGPEVWDRRPWRRYLWPSVLFLMGVLMFPVMVFFTNSTIHMLAHGSWAEVMMLAGGATLGLAAGKLTNPLWNLTVPLALVVSGIAFLVHEQNSWLYSRASFGHHLLGWLAIAGAVFPLVSTFRPRLTAAHAGFALLLVVFAVVLYADRDTAPIFGHLSPEAGIPHR